MEHTATLTNFPIATAKNPASVNLKSRDYKGTPPDTCQICGNPIGSTFVDGKTRMGMWADMCHGCHTTYGLGIGVGLGQMYDTATGKLLHG